MDRLDNKVGEYIQPRLGDWELDTSDPLSPLYEPSLKHMIIRHICVPIKNLYGSIKSRFQ